MGIPIGPGPGNYLLPPTVGYTRHDATRYRYPMYSFGTKTAQKNFKIGPGPTYKLCGIHDAPAWSFGARFPQRSTMRAPGPGAHAPEKCPSPGSKAPAYSLGARPPGMRAKIGPGPNAYHPCLGPTTPAFSMAARLGYGGKVKSPGPAVYFQKDQDTYRSRAPKYSLGARLAGPFGKGKTPGPAAYPPGLYNTKRTTQAYSFGTRHCGFCPPMIVVDDFLECI